MPGDIKRQIIESGKLLYRRGMINALEGNVSMRVGDVVYITPSRRCKELLTEDDILGVDMDGRVVEGTGMPSSEVKMHLAAYRLRPDIGGCIHCHSPFATAFAINNQPIVTDAYPEMIVLFGQVPVVPYGTPSTDAIHAGLGLYLHEYDAVLMGNHGVTTVGTDAYDAFLRAEAVESIAKTLYLARTMGREHSLDAENLAVLRAMRRAARGQ